MSGKIPRILMISYLRRKIRTHFGKNVSHESLTQNGSQNKHNLLIYHSCFKFIGLGFEVVGKECFLVTIVHRNSYRVYHPL